MKHRHLIIALPLTLAVAGYAYATEGGEFNPAQMKQPPVSMATAGDTALKAVPGHIVKGELERERGGSGLRYSFEVAGKNGIREVGVDADTGKVLENSRESEEADD